MSEILDGDAHGNREIVDGRPQSSFVTGGDSHDHAGGDGAQVDHGGLGGLGDDDHTQYRKTSVNIDHGALDGLSDDDHTQYLKDTDYNANTILKADTDDTPVALTVAEQRIVGRITSGSITGLTAAQVKTLLGFIADLVDDTTPQLGGDLDTNAKNIEIKPTAGGADHTTSGLIYTGTAGETVAFGDVCYFKASDSELYLGKADAATTVPGIAMAMEDITDGNTGSFLKIGYARDDSWAWTIKGLIYVSITGTTTNTLTQTAPTASGDQVQIVGYAETADIMWFEPNLAMAEVA